MRIVYIDIDSLRADHLGCYGYGRKTSPHIDAIAGEAVRFNNCYTPDAPCLPSRTAFYSGRFGIQTGVVGHGGTAADPKVQGRERGFRDWFDEQGLARQLQKAGLHTAMISPFGQRHSAHWFYAGFNEIHNTGGGGMESMEVVQPVVDKWMADNVAKDNWYLHVNVWDPHTPYRAPESLGEPFKDDPLPAWLTEEVVAAHTKMAGPHTAMDIAMYDDRENPRFPRQPGKVTDQKSLRRLIDGYDTGVLYADMLVGRIVAALKQAGVYEETAIIVSGDHGENLGELGIYAEHGTADQFTCRVPMIVKWPASKGGRAAGVDNGLHYNLDWAPTLVELLGGKPCEIWDGMSYAGAICSAPKKAHGLQSLGLGASERREDLVISQCAHVCQRSVRWGNWLYMRTYHDGFHLFPQEMLFDLQADPHEQHNLAAEHPETSREGAWRLQRWHDQQMQKMATTCTDVVDPLWTVIREGGPLHATHAGPQSQLPKYLERLEKTGRAAGAKALRAKYRQWLPEERGEAV